MSGPEKRPTQCKRILRYLRHHSWITKWQAGYELGIMAFNRRLSDLKEMGYVIEDEWVERMNEWGEKVRFKKYRIKPDSGVNGELKL